MRVHPGGCLLTVLALLALPVLTIAWFAVLFFGGFNDNGDPGAAASIARLLDTIKILGTVAMALAGLGAVWAVSVPLGTAGPTPPVPEAAPSRSVSVGPPRRARPSGMPIDRAALVFGGLLIAGFTLPVGYFKVIEFTAARDTRVKQREQEASAGRVLERLKLALTQEGVLRVMPCPADDVPSKLYMPHATCFASDQGGQAVGEAYARALRRLKVGEFNRQVTIEAHEGWAANYIDDLEGRDPYFNAVQFSMEYVSRDATQSRTDSAAWWRRQSFQTFLAVEPLL
ncbi:hypothetical protein [Deinococcus sp. RM]|uniref:hypothetical protein n=1 Tax=Deinococcus sp. RM TaxID=2316359 RepID=UPI000E681B13|nr:hypothetical protein [Deinococcus sp. RM]RIY06774.1 hypothetical protein D3W47_08930 [Deinococcus sp. RM]